MLKSDIKPFLFIRREEEMERPACKLWIYPYSRNPNPTKRNGAHFFFKVKNNF